MCVCVLHSVVLSGMYQTASPSVLGQRVVEGAVCGDDHTLFPHTVITQDSGHTPKMTHHYHSELLLGVERGQHTHTQPVLGRRMC